MHLNIYIYIYMDIYIYIYIYMFLLIYRLITQVLYRDCIPLFAANHP